MADTIASANWSGYVAHGHGAVFHAVRAAWAQPAAVCPGLYPTFSATWVGLGGYNLGATAVEQIGTELDCDVSGQPRVSAWYELVPALPQTVPLAVRPGDRVAAGVSAADGMVRLWLSDLTRHESFAKAVPAGSIDVSSADWILEAPSECDPYGYCVTLQLADYGSVRLSRAEAQLASGARWASIASRRWRWTRITLLPDPYYYAGNDSAAVSTPSALGSGGRSFEVEYGQTVAPAGMLAGVGRHAGSRSGTVNPGGRLR